MKQLIEEAAERVLKTSWWMWCWHGDTLIRRSACLHIKGNQDKKINMAADGNPVVFFRSSIKHSMAVLGRLLCKCHIGYKYKFTYWKCKSRVTISVNFVKVIQLTAFYWTFLKFRCDGVKLSAVLKTGTIQVAGKWWGAAIMNLTDRTNQKHQSSILNLGREAEKDGARAKPVHREKTMQSNKNQTIKHDNG